MATTLTKKDLNELASKAASAPRKRSHHNLHASLDAAVQRLAIAMEPETYVRPHRHPQTWELYLPLAGAFKIVLFNDAGLVTDCHLLGGDAGACAFELPANTWHSVVSLQPGSIIFEIKEGPYIRPTDADIAAWSPAEDTAASVEFQQALLQAQAGETIRLTQG